MQIQSQANQQLKWARRVRDGREPSYIFIEGERLVEEAISAGLNLHAAFHLAEVEERFTRLLERLRSRQCPVYETGRAAFDTITDTVNSQGIVVIAGRPDYNLSDIFSRRAGASAPLLVALDAIQDPGNLGTILRTSEGAGASGVVALHGTTNPFSPKALRSAMGSVFRLPVVTGIGLETLLAECRARGLMLVAAAADRAVEHTAFDWRRPVAVFFGNEARGLSSEVLAACDARVGIRLAPPVESLNVAAAAAVMLFEAARQRREEGE